MNFLHTDNQIVVVFKPHNMSSEELKEQVIQKLKEENLKTSYLEQIYPISKQASGIVLFAVSSKAKKRIEQQIEKQAKITAESAEEMENPDFSLKYFAVCVGEPQLQNNIIYNKTTDKTTLDISGYFVKRDKKTEKLEIIPSLVEGAVNIFDTYRVIKNLGKISLVQIEGGFRFEDETRFVLAHNQGPVFGDKLYGGDTLAKNTNLALCLVELRLVHPSSGKNLVFRVFPEIQKKPWSYFEIEKLLKI